jgi:hypothetical protein
MGQEFNFVIDNENFESNEGLVESLFDLNENERVQIVPSTFDMFDILVDTGLFRSKSEARKNWKRTGQDVPVGFTDLERIGKLKNRITIWNPVK